MNTDDDGAIRMKKEEQIEILAYGVPAILGGLFLSFGRLTCGSAPRSSGAKGMFAFSGLFTFAALVAFVGAAVCEKLLFRETYRQLGIGFLILGGAAELWFLAGLASSGVALKRPNVARAVGLIGFTFCVIATIPTIVWPVYLQEFRPKPLSDDWILYEKSALMLGWLLAIAFYWRAVRGLRRAIRDFLESVPV
jgi:hypothetical protein